MNTETNINDGYKLIPLSEITDEAREIAVQWIEGYEPNGFDITNKHKLASDIMNYAKKYSQSSTPIQSGALSAEDVREKIDSILSDYKVLGEPVSEDDEREEFVCIGESDFKKVVHELSSILQLKNKAEATGDEAEFDDYCVATKDDFTNFINTLEWDNKLRTKVENLIICFDQMMQRLINK